MTAVTPGTGATIVSDTAEGQLQEVLTYLRQKEGETLANPTEAQAIQATHNLNTLVFSGSYDLPVTQAINGQGQLVLSATHYLSTPSFSPGSGGTFKSATPEAYALEVLQFLQAREQSSGFNPNNRNFITGSFNSDTNRYSGSFSLPVELALVNGLPTYNAIEYLS